MPKRYGTLNQLKRMMHFILSALILMCTGIFFSKIYTVIHITIFLVLVTVMLSGYRCGKLPSKLLLALIFPSGVLMKADRGTIFTSSSISAITEESLSSSLIVIYKFKAPLIIKVNKTLNL